MLSKKAKWWHLKSDWIALPLDKIIGNFQGYTPLQSGRISKGRQTMMDLSDEKKANAWVASIWKESDGIKEWPVALRPKRPEQIQLRYHTESRKMERVAGPEANRRRNKNLEILEKPPVFLMIKDLKKEDGFVKDYKLSVCDLDLWQGEDSNGNEFDKHRPLNQQKTRLSQTAAENIEYSF